MCAILILHGDYTKVLEIRSSLDPYHFYEFCFRISVTTANNVLCHIISKLLFFVSPLFLGYAEKVAFYVAVLTFSRVLVK